MKNGIGISAALVAVCLTQVCFAETDDGSKILPIVIESKSCADRIDITNPDQACWKDAAPVTLGLARQNVQEPKIQDTGIAALTVRSVHGRGIMAFLIEWADATKDDGLRSEKFADGVAVEFPLATDTMPDYRMGNDDKPVCLMLWRAERQRARLDSGVSFHDENYPNAWSDAYTFDPKAVGAKVTQAAKTEREKYLASRAAGNPDVIGIAPVVEELSARSWVRLTVQKEQDARGYGAWKNGRWRVIIARPMVTADEEDARLEENSTWPVAFAAWDGAKQNAGPRKMVVDGWVQVKIAP